MCGAQAHRGPDGEGVWCEGQWGLGHRRLTIIDLSDRGAQPMVDVDRRVAITFNGEIYNYVELRDELITRGHRFTSTSDTEVLLRGYLEWGTAMVERLNGMFAFAIADMTRRHVFAARDPIGQKPLLYFTDRQGLVFASELTALLLHPRAPRRLSRPALASFLTYEAFPPPFTPFEGIVQLPAGCAMLYFPDEGRLREWRFWTPLPLEPAVETQADPAEDDFARLDELLHDAVGRHLRSDVPVGVFLSGGIDSTTLALVASDILGGPNLRTFTVRQLHRSFDEADEARATARQLGTSHHETTLAAGEMVSAVPAILAHASEPLADPGLLGIHQVARFAADHVKVVLSGDGGDEFLCGYPPFAKWLLGERLERLPRWLTRGVLPHALAMLPAQYQYMGTRYKAQLVLRGVGRPAAVRNIAWIGAFLPWETAEIMVGGSELDILRRGEDGIEPVCNPSAAAHDAAAHSPLARLALEYQTTYLSHSICSHTDKACMAHSLEARAPFLDRELMGYMNDLPLSWKLRRGQGKWLFRRYLARRLGTRVAEKRKQGFTVPLALWLRGELKSFAGDLLSPAALAADGLFEPRVVERLWHEHQSGRANHYKKLWTLITFLAWRRAQAAAIEAR
jgi:asparagine synthase (glutamine-hydrolysing)